MPRGKKKKKNAKASKTGKPHDCFVPIQMVVTGNAFDINNHINRSCSKIHPSFFLSAQLCKRQPILEGAKSDKANAAARAALERGTATATKANQRAARKYAKEMAQRAGFSRMNDRGPLMDCKYDGPYTGRNCTQIKFPNQFYKYEWPKHMLQCHTDPDHWQFVCSHEGCGYKSWERSHITRHFNIHLSDAEKESLKLHKCDLCSYSTIDRYKLKRHRGGRKCRVGKKW